MKRTLLVIGAALVGWACQENKTPEPTKAAAPETPAKVVLAPATQPIDKLFPALADQTNLHNAHVVTPKIVSGAQPEGDASFALLKEMGIKTIVSVDGAKPDVEGAHKYGLTYVHLPITYSGVKPEEGRAIAKALRELPGPIYVHCHHGKHRSAAAVAVACVYNGMLPPDQAEALLTQFGTGANYKGLWQAARDARPLSQAELDSIKVMYVEQAKIPPLADAMVLVDQRWDHIKAIQKAGWAAPKDHPDLDPPHEALQIEELIREIHRNDQAHAKIPEFGKLLDQAEAGARQLQTSLSAKPQADAAGADTAFKVVAGTCAACHKAYRD